MTLDEARQSIGQLVVYHPSADEPVEQGVVTSVNDYYVFVRYGSDVHSKATAPGWLAPLISTTTEE